MSTFFPTADGRLISSSLVEIATPVPDSSPPRWRLSLKRGLEPVEVSSIDFLRERLIKAGRHDIAVDQAGVRRRVLFWRLRHGEPIAEPILGLVVDPAPIDAAAIFRGSDLTHS